MPGSGQLHVQLLHVLVHQCASLSQVPSVSLCSCRIPGALANPRTHMPTYLARRRYAVSATRSTALPFLPLPPPRGPAAKATRLRTRRSKPGLDFSLPMLFASLVSLGRQQPVTYFSPPKAMPRPL